jgi:hypothetical protein
MKPSLRPLLSLATLLLAAASLLQAAGLDDSNVVWDSPSADSRGSMPIGNGDIGANVWVEPSGDLLLLLSKSDAWDEVSRLCKLGQLRIKLPSVTDFRHPETSDVLRIPGKSPGAPFYMSAFRVGIRFYRCRRHG